jgi:titin
MIQLPKSLPTGVNGQYSQNLTSVDSSLITNDNQIQVAMICINSVGDGDMSNAVSVMVGPLPNAPTISSVVTVGAGYLISWNAPSDLQYYSANSILRAELQDTLSNATLWSLDLTGNPSQTSNLVTSALVGQSFSLRMRYINAAGNGAWSGTINYKQLSAPSVVRNLTATGSNGAITLTWDAPLNDGGVPITNYRVLDANGGLLQTVTSLTATILGLTNGNSYAYSVQASNGQYSFASSITGIPFNISSAPTNVTAVPSNQAITLSWGPPASLGGLPVVDYAVEYKKTGLPANTAPQVVNTQGATTTTISQLTNGTAYEFVVYAMTGDKKAKGTSAATIMATPSSTPSYVSATISSPSVAVSVMPNGSPITSYVAIGIFSTGKISYKLITVSNGMTAFGVSLGTVQLNADFSTDANITASDTLTNWLMVANNSTGSSGVMTNISMK